MSTLRKISRGLASGKSSRGKASGNFLAPRYAIIEKEVGETPLQAAERLRVILELPSSVPLAYAGRLDPMASGKLLILIGDECKKQEEYHAFDKEYMVEVLLGVGSDTGDVLGLLEAGAVRRVSDKEVKTTLAARVGTISLPYPKFSSRTVKGKPLHTWTLENRLGEIEIPVKTSNIHRLTFVHIRTVSKDEILNTVRTKIETIPEVTDARKMLGADFRRDAVRASWDEFEKTGIDTYQILTFRCIASSGTYMRSLASLIAHDLGMEGLAYSIHRTNIGTYVPLTKQIGVWMRRF